MRDVFEETVECLNNYLVRAQIALDEAEPCEQEVVLNVNAL